jgi:TetR/AcrR family transcriptional repressor of nem operon
MVAVIYLVKAQGAPMEANMRVTRQKSAENRQKIVETASRLFREKGFDGVGLDAIMADAGLTHGAFYRHFGSKADLEAEAVELGLAMSAERVGAKSLGEYLDAYLSQQHRDGVGAGCVMAALGGDIGRNGAGPKRRMSAHVRSAINRFAGWIGGPDAAAARRRAIATAAGMLGALILARAVDDPDLSAEILAAGRAEFGGETP